MALKSFKCFIALVITAVVISSQITYPVHAKTYKLKYTALGDSIAYGMGADKGKGYVELLYNYLKSNDKYSALELANVSVPGQTSGELLQRLKNDEALKAQLKDSSVITISIGGNNLLLPVMRSLSQAFGVNPYKEDFLQELSKQMALNPKRNELLLRLLRSEDFMNQIVKGTEDFKSHWTEIVSIIKTIAPEAKIYAMTIYNPLDKKEIMYSVLNDYIVEMNRSILALANNYIVADACSMFLREDGQRFTSFSLAGGNFDPHPNNEGHRAIYLAHVNAVTSLSLSRDREGMDVGEVLQLKAIISPAEAYDKKVVWSSDNSKVAEVDDSGRVTAKAVGETKITAALYGGKTAVCNVNVKKRGVFFIGRMDLIISAVVVGVLFIGLGGIIAGRRKHK